MSTLIVWVRHGQIFPILNPPPLATFAARRQNRFIRWELRVWDADNGFRKGGQISRRRPLPE